MSANFLFKVSSKSRTKCHVHHHHSYLWYSSYIIIVIRHALKIIGGRRKPSDGHQEYQIHPPTIDTLVTGMVLNVMIQGCLKYQWPINEWVTMSAIGPQGWWRRCGSCWDFASVKVSNTSKNIIVVFFSNHCQKNWVNALSLDVKQTEPESW